MADTSYTGATARRTTYTYDTHERPNATTDPLGTWTIRYEASRGIPETIVTPFADSLLWNTDARGRPVSTLVQNAGALQMISQARTTTGEILMRAHGVGAPGSYTAGLFERQEDILHPVGPALGPAWMEQHGAGAPLDTLRDSLRYDGWERLVAWVGTKDTVVAQDSSITLVVAQDSFSYSQTGNVSTPGGGQGFDATPDRLLQAVIGGVTRTYVYDRAGNLIQAKEGATVVFEYGYDPLNRLVSVRRLGTLIARYGYDVLGRRIAKRVYSGASGGTIAYTRFVYHGDQVAFETDSAGGIGLRYTWDRGTDRLVGVRDAAGNQYYAVTDLLGSVRGLGRRDGTWWMSQRFGPYGAQVARDTTTAGPAVKLRYGWTGREYDAETGWYFHRARYYSPELRRFVQEDPIGGTNPYAYVDGRVMEAVDPDGLVAMDPDGLGSFGGGIGSFGGYGRGEGGMGAAALIAWGEAGWQSFLARSNPSGLVATMSNGTTKSCSEIPNACANWLAQKGGARRLNSGDKARLGNMCQSIDCNEVTLYTNVKGDPLTLGHNIYISNPEKTPLLAHEMTHVWQYEQWGAVTYYARGLWTQFKHRLLGINQYEWLNNTHRPFSQQGMEQQGQIVEDCFHNNLDYACGLSPFRP